MRAGFLHLRPTLRAGRHGWRLPPLVRRPGFVLPVLALFMALGASTAPVSSQESEDLSSEQRAHMAWKQGYLLHIYGQYEKAIALFEESISIHPTADAHTYLGWSLSHLGKLPEAIAECEKAIELDPEFGNPYNDIGVYLIELGRPEEAIPWLKKAMDAKRYCCYEFPHYNLGRVLVLKGDLLEAERSFKRALSYSPNYLPALKALEFLEEHGLRAL